MDVVAIAAIARNGVIGSGPDIPWRLRGDQARFRELTTGHVLVMGRRTYSSIGRPLPGRTTVVISRDPTWRAEGIEVAADLSAALARAAELDPAGPVFVAGGGEVYRAALPHTTRLEITEVELAPEGDVTFPTIDPATWVEVARDPHEGYSFVSYVRRRPEPWSATAIH